MWMLADRSSWLSPRDGGARLPQPRPLVLRRPRPLLLPLALLLLGAAVLAAWSAPLGVDFSRDCFVLVYSV